MPDFKRDNNWLLTICSSDYIKYEIVVDIRFIIAVIMNNCMHLYVYSLAEVVTMILALGSKIIQVYSYKFNYLEFNT